MNVKIGAEAALFPEKEYISGIFIACSAPANIVVEQTQIYKVMGEEGVW